MDRERQRKKRSNVLSVLGMLTLLMFIFRLWPILMLILIGVVIYVFWQLFRLEKVPVKPVPQVQTPLLPPPSAPVSEETVLNSAFALLQRRITEQVISRYPEARWVWSASNARERFAQGEPLEIMLNHAGGYQTAVVRVHHLQFCGLDYVTADQPRGTEPLEPDETHDDPEQEPVDYGLLAFEWVDANLQDLNTRCNEVIAQGQDSFRIPAEQLPHGDSWPSVCEELIRNGFTAAEPLADGILVQIQSR